MGSAEIGERSSEHAVLISQNRAACAFLIPATGQITPAQPVNPLVFRPKRIISTGPNGTGGGGASHADDGGAGLGAVGGALRAGGGGVQRAGCAASPAGAGGGATGRHAGGLVGREEGDVRRQSFCAGLTRGAAQNVTVPAPETSQFLRHPPKMSQLLRQSAWCASKVSGGTESLKMHCHAQKEGNEGRERGIMQDGAGTMTPYTWTGPQASSSLSRITTLTWPDRCGDRATPEPTNWLGRCCRWSGDGLCYDAGSALTS